MIGILLKHTAPAPKTDLKVGLKAIRQRLAYAGPALRLADMDAAVLREASKALRKPPNKLSK